MDVSDEPIEAIAREFIRWCDGRHHDEIVPTPILTMANRMRAAVALIPQPPVSAAPEGWLPIASAPRDGTRFLAMGGALHSIDIISWNSAVGAWDATDCVLDDCDDEPLGYSRPTHWQPLPEAPK